MTVEEAIDAGLVFAGTPDDVWDQLMAFYDHPLTRQRIGFRAGGERPTPS